MCETRALDLKFCPSSAAAAAKSLQSCPTLCNPIDGSPPGSPVPGILQARTLEWVAISFSNAWKWKVKMKSLSRVQLLATPWTAAHQAPLSMGFSRQEYWNGVPLPSSALVLTIFLLPAHSSMCFQWLLPAPASTPAVPKLCITKSPLLRCHSLGPDACSLGLWLLLEDKFYHVVDDNPPTLMLLFWSSLLSSTYLLLLYSNLITLITSLILYSLETELSPLRCPIGISKIICSTLNL